MIYAELPASYNLYWEKVNLELEKRKLQLEVFIIEDDKKLREYLSKLIHQDYLKEKMNEIQSLKNRIT